jgi:2',3'-cyclic-nucleotide 2'-phosphodiesterase (5'-nucleotidase family)
MRATLNRTPLITLALAATVAIVVATAAVPLRGQQEEPSSPRFSAPLTILQINDVYSTVPIDGMGGLARVATLKKQLAAAGRTPFLMLAGDFLSPSVASSVFQGEQMVAALNAVGLDMATLGNHEFDFGSDALIKRMAEAKWQWLISNVIDVNTGKPIGGAAPYVERTFGTLKVGFIGLCLITAEITSDNLAHVRLVDPLEAAATYLPILEKDGVDVIVALTHLPMADDQRLIERFPEIDLVVGGHEHYPLTATENRALISKAGSDAKYVARIDVKLPEAAAAVSSAASTRHEVDRFFELIPITAAIPDDPKTVDVVNSYESRLGTALDMVVGTTKVPLDAVSVRMRGGETNLGDMVADAMRTSVNADVAIINSGAIRGDRVYPAGPLTRRTVLAIHPLGNVLCKVAVSGRVVLDALNNGVAKFPVTAGQFPQVSGLTFRIVASAPPGSRVSDVKVDGKPLEADKTYTVATADYMLKGGDGYGMLSSQQVLIGPQAGDLLAVALEKYIAARGEIAPSIEGRVETSK